MYIRSEKYVIETFTKTLRRIFRLNSQWNNIDYELIQISSGSSISIFEQYNEENERYPMVMVAGTNVNYSNPAFNNLIGEYDNNSLDIGERPLSYTLFDNFNSVFIPFPNTVNTEIVRGFASKIAWAGQGTGGGEIALNLYKDYDTTPLLVSSGSIDGAIFINVFDYYYADLYPKIVCDSSKYALQLLPLDDSTYYAAIDTTTNDFYYQRSQICSGSIVSKVMLQAFTRVGGNVEGSLVLKCRAKNSTAIARNLAELIAIYTQLLKHAEISRKVNSLDLTLNNYIVSGIVNEWLQKGIVIKGIRTGGLEVTRRGDNDNLFAINVTIDYLADWFEDYNQETIENINIDITVSDP